jgi:hypothetical protein
MLMLLWGNPKVPTFLKCGKKLKSSSMVGQPIYFYRFFNKSLEKGLENIHLQIIFKYLLSLMYFVLAFPHPHLHLQKKSPHREVS